MKNNKVIKLVQLAILTAILLVMNFTSLGYLRIGVVSITFLMLPVVLGSIIIGPVYGAVLGAVFGFTSFIQCFGGDWFGTTLMDLNPVYAVIICFVPRILMGLLAGLIFKAIHRIDKTGVISFAAASVSGALLNTGLFTLTFVLLYGNNLELMDRLVNGGFVSEGTLITVIVTLFITVNMVLEAVACLVIGTPLSKALYRFKAE